MSVNKYTTINDLGLKHSNRYAHDIQEADFQLVQDSNLVPLKTTIASTKPFIPSEFDHLFSPFIKASISALFTPPSEYDISTLFSRELAPSFGSSETLQELLDKMTALPADWEQNPPPAANKKSLDHLTAAMKQIVDLNRTLELARDSLARFYKA